MANTLALVLALLSTLARTLVADQSDLWQRLQRPRSNMEVLPYPGMMGQYYPMWTRAAVLLDDASARNDPAPADYLADDYGYDVAPEQPTYVYGDEGDNFGAGLEEQAYKDLLMRYLLREMETQDTLPVVRRRSESRAAPSTTTTTTTVSPSTTSTTVSPVVEKGQKEVALLRPPSESRHRTLNWPQELESRQLQEKRMPKLPQVASPPKSEPNQPMDILTAQLNNLRSRAH